MKEIIIFSILFCKFIDLYYKYINPQKLFEQIVRENIMFLDHYLYNVLHTSFPQRPQLDKENLLVTVILTYCTCIIDTFIRPTCDSSRVKEYKLPES